MDKHKEEMWKEKRKSSGNINKFNQECGHPTTAIDQDGNEYCTFCLKTLNLKQIIEEKIKKSLRSGRVF